MVKRGFGVLFLLWVLVFIGFFSASADATVCTDSDGANIYTGGIVTVTSPGPVYYYDFCDSGSSQQTCSIASADRCGITERTCVLNNWNNYVTDCPRYFACQDGGSGAGDYCRQAWDCTDSDSSTLGSATTASLSSSGHVTEWSLWGTTNEYDDCQADGTSIREYFCSDDYMYDFRTYDCPATKPYCKADASGDKCVECTTNSQCGAGNTCQNNVCCIKNYNQFCDGGDVYWYDSCGNRGTVADTCDGSTPYCSGGYCVECTTNNECDDGNECTTDTCTGTSAKVCSHAAIAGCGGGSCSCTSYVDQGCGGGTCTADKMYQTRSCTPNECSTESRCVTRASCGCTPDPAVECGDDGCGTTLSCSDEEACNPAQLCVSTTCGDGLCSVNEIGSCPGDCGGCGDGECLGSETCSSCAADCGACPSGGCTIDEANDLSWTYGNEEISQAVKDLEVKVTIKAGADCANQPISELEILDEDDNRVKLVSQSTNLNSNGDYKYVWDAVIGNEFYFKFRQNSVAYSSPGLNVSEPCYFYGEGKVIDSCDDYSTYTADDNLNEDACISDCAGVGVALGGRCRWDDSEKECFFSTRPPGSGDEGYYCRVNYEDLGTCGADDAYLVINTTTTKRNESSGVIMPDLDGDCVGSCGTQLCSINSPCPKVVQLPFFTFWNVVGVIIVVAILYILYGMAKKDGKKNKKRGK